MARIMVLVMARVVAGLRVRAGSKARSWSRVVGGVIAWVLLG